MPNLTSIGEETESGASNYHSLQVTLEKRLSHGFTILANYTRSKSLDDLPPSQTLQANGGAPGGEPGEVGELADDVDRGRMVHRLGRCGVDQHKSAHPVTVVVEVVDAFSAQRYGEPGGVQADALRSAADDDDPPAGPLPQRRRN